jgi:hypothetical protein
VTPEDLAQLFHETYEDLAPEFAYETRLESAKPWDLVPENNKKLMVATAAAVMERIGKHMGRQHRAISTALSVLDHIGEVEAPVGVYTARAALRFGVGLEISDEDRARLKIVDPELLEMDTR